MAQVTLQNGGQGRRGAPCRAAGGAALILALLWLTPGCPSSPGTEKLTREVEALKGEVAALKERVNQLEANQKLLTEMVKLKTGPSAPAAPAMGSDLPGMPPASAAPAGAPLSLDELFKNQHQLLGTRVTVKGMPGPVLMHKKTLFMNGPGGGMLEVIYGNIQDRKQVERLTSQALDTPITVTGLLSGAPGQAKGLVHLILMADSVEF